MRLVFDWRHAVGIRQLTVGHGQEIGHTGWAPIVGWNFFFMLKARSNDAPQEGASMPNWMAMIVGRNRAKQIQREIG
jgi:hypothetical protein